MIQRQLEGQINLVIWNINLAMVAEDGKHRVSACIYEIEFVVE